jgi:hypothetical protein
VNRDITSSSRLAIRGPDGFTNEWVSLNYGLEEKSLKYKGEYFDEILMVKFLSRPG